MTVMTLGSKAAELNMAPLMAEEKWQPSAVPGWRFHAVQKAYDSSAVSFVAAQGASVGGFICLAFSGFIPGFSRSWQRSTKIRANKSKVKQYPPKLRTLRPVTELSRVVYNHFEGSDGQPEPEFDGICF